MKVKVLGQPATFADLKPGDLFCALSVQKLFGLLCISSQSQELALVFGSNGPKLTAARQYNELVRYRDAVIVPDLTSVQGSSRVDIPVGALVCFGDKSYLYASTTGMHVNVDTGAIEAPPAEGACNVYPNWRAVLREDDAETVLFSFPPS